MSEVTHYYAVEKISLEEIKRKLETADILSAVVDAPMGDSWIKADDNWVVVEAPLITGFKVPGDFSTFSVISNPWEKLKETFTQIIELYVEEGQNDWALTTCLNGVQKDFKFYGNLSTEFSSEDEIYLSQLFSISFKQLEPVLKTGKVYEFCQLIKLPYLEMEDQDRLRDVIPQFGRVVFTSKLAD